jgi:hypothetical protein
LSALPTVSTTDLAAVVQGFPLRGRLQASGPYGSGHINDTFAVVVDQAGTPVRYILQRINHLIFKNVPALMDNVERVTAHVTQCVEQAGLDEASRRALTLVPAGNGRPYLQDAQGCFWRCYLFVERAQTYDLVGSPRQAYEAARAFGRFQRQLVDLPGARLHETIPGFHDTRSRFEALRRAAVSDPCGRAAEVGGELDFAFSREALVDVLAGLQARGDIPERVTHNDTKFNNVLLDDATGEGLCVIDLDTVMPGLALHDFGDMVRSATNAAAEDESDVTKVVMRMPIFEGLVTGYLASAGDFLNEVERAHLAFAGKLITFEIGLRFLTDYLNGDVYFKIKHPAHNRTRGRNQFALVRSIEQQEGAMRAFVDAQLKTA